MDDNYNGNDTKLLVDIVGTQKYVEHYVLTSAYRIHVRDGYRL